MVIWVRLRMRANQALTNETFACSKAVGAPLRTQYWGSTPCAQVGSDGFSARQVSLLVSEHVVEFGTALTV